MTMTSLAKTNIVGTRNGPKMKKTGLRKSVKRKWRLFSVMIVHVGSGRLFVFFFPVKVIWLII